MLDLVEETLGTFGFTQYEVNLSTRPEKSVGDDAIWATAEGALQEALALKGWAYQARRRGRLCLRVWRGQGGQGGRGGVAWGVTCFGHPGLGLPGEEEEERSSFRAGDGGRGRCAERLLWGG